MDGVLGTARSVPSSPFEKHMPVESKMLKPFEWPGPYLIQDQKFNLSLGKARKPASYFMEGDEIRVVGTQNENGLFSSSLSELFSRKLLEGWSWEKMASPPGQRDSEFTGGNINSQSGGSVSSVVGEHPSRTLFVRNINTNVEDSELEALFEQYGDIRTLYTTCKHRGFVMISYYDIRAARNAIRALQDKPLRRRKLDIHFSIPKDNPSEKDINQGTLAAFNLDSYVSNEVLHQIFGVYGEVKEISEVPQRSHGKFIEFYDVRAAEAALRCILLPPFPPDSERDECGPYLQQSSPPSNSTTGFTGVHSAIRFTGSPSLENVFHHGISSHVPSNVFSLMRVESLGNQSSLPECGHSKGQLRVEFHGSLNFHRHSFPEYHDGYTNGAPGNSLDMAVNFNARPSDRIENRQFCRVSSNGQTLELNDAVFGFSGNVNVPSPGHHYMWKHHLWDRRHTRAGESPNASGFHPGSLGNMRISGNSPHHLEFVSQNIFSHVGGNCMDLPIPSKNVGLPSPNQRCLIFPDRGQMIPLMSPFDSPNGRARNDGSANQADNKKQFELDIDRIMRGDDNRTTRSIQWKKSGKKFNSEKVASLAYGRIQGKAALIAHFQNSSLMNEDKRCRPIYPLQP
ncbi:MEI2-like protein 5 [Actinidia rufa]|uniref:MEI2-like protein 5 n=1 Tax=Actinidia rufa TaxID=165716 RepID=A0A7J0DG54_9ERIC|nr:MEI2-like protein 5 [Actinidia rufa]